MSRLENFVQRVREIDGTRSEDNYLYMFIAAGAAGITMWLNWDNVHVSQWYLNHAARLVEAFPYEILALYQMGVGLIKSEKETIIQETEERRQRIIKRREGLWGQSIHRY